MAAEPSAATAALRAALVCPPAGPASERQGELRVRAILAKRARFGITRVGSLTRLDRVGVPIVQVARPASLSNAVSQGKGLDWAASVASGLMESLESWAAESIGPDRLTVATIAEAGDETRRLFQPWVVDGAAAGWDRIPLSWIDGFDLLDQSVALVPLTLVDTVYTVPSPHPVLFPRVSTGLGAGWSFEEAIVQAALEVVERHSLALALEDAAFFETRQTGLPDRLSPAAESLRQRIADAGLLCGVWDATGASGPPVYHCHLMEKGPPDEILPLPSEGTACRFTHEAALVAALLEACQARAAALSGAREDITRLHYPAAFDRPHLAEWRSLIDRRTAPLIPAEPPPAPEGTRPQDRVVAALKAAGARRAVAVPLFADRETGVHVVRLVCPPLHLHRGA